MHGFMYFSSEAGPQGKDGPYGVGPGVAGRQHPRHPHNDEAVSRCMQEVSTPHRGGQFLVGSCMSMVGVTSAGVRAH